MPKIKYQWVETFAAGRDPDTSKEALYQARVYLIEKKKSVSLKRLPYPSPVAGNNSGGSNDRANVIEEASAESDFTTCPQRHWLLL